MKKLLQSLVSTVLILIFGMVLLLMLDRFVLPTSLLFEAKNSGIAAAAVPAMPEEPHALALSRQALQNIGITDTEILNVTLSSYDKTTSFPAMVVNRPGRSAFRIPAPFTGVVQKVYVEPGMVVEPNQPLFDIGLTHEELIRCQNDLIALCQKRDMVQRELDRLGSLSADIAPKAKRDIDFQKTEIDAQIETQRSILLIHGIGEKEILETIETKRTLVRTITIRVPEIAEEPCCPEQGGDEPCNKHAHPVIQMESLFVDRGQLVNSGDPLCQLVDLSILYIEGRASSNDENVLATALMEHCYVTAYFDGERVERLGIRYIDTRIDPTSRSLRFYVELPNSVVIRDAEKGHHHPWLEDNGSGVCDIHRHYINWKYRPGRRCELKVEYDTIPDCIIVPREALAESGSEAFLFEWTGSEPEGDQRKIWTKRSVHVLHRGKSQVAIANDGSIFPGAKIAAQGAGQLLVALTSGGGQLQSTCPCGDH